ncbi:MAG: aromatic acid exporter family protein [Clostridiaceae bacterium]
MNGIKHIFGLRTVKTALGAALAIYLSQRLGLSYAVNSGIIVILSIQTTKRKSRDLAIMRLGSTVLALTIGAVMFSLIGFTALAFGAYVLIFIPIAVKLKFNDGIVPCSVLVSHLLAVQSVSLPWLGNEMMQMVIGAGIGFLLNLQMPSLEKKLNEDILEIEKLQKAILLNMAESLKKHTSSEKEDELYKNLEEKLKLSYERALAESENHLIRNVTYYVKYIEMRSVQFEIMRYMKKYSKKIYKNTERTEMVEALTKIVADQLHELNTTDKLISELVEYKEIFKSMELPTTREDFENRASLYEFVGDLEHLLDVKKSFVLNLDPSDRMKFEKDTEMSESAA